ncbi:MAG: helix-turn-helix transcriptional regulator [Verrucomicrobia bacterium]|nr:helix-turn-helix transcriptional regulator [Verrucomicrobiota bacterium]
MGNAAPQNLVGPMVRKLRYQRGLTQAMLTARCSQAGWDVSENTIAKIEAQIRCVTDREVVFLAKALRVPLQTVFP